MTMDMSIVARDFERWVMEVLDVPHPALNGSSPCPFARQAWLAGRYRISEVADLTTDLGSTPDRWEEGCDLWIHVFDPEASIDPIWLAEATREANRLLIRRGYIALEGHPDIPERVMDCEMNQGRYAYAIVQPLEKLRKGRASLVGKGYYDNWPADMLAQIVGIRENTDGTPS
jgi:hypothetical protein